MRNLISKCLSIDDLMEDFEKKLMNQTFLEIGNTKNKRITFDEKFMVIFYKNKKNKTDRRSFNLSDIIKYYSQLSEIISEDDKKRMDNFIFENELDAFEYI